MRQRWVWSEMSILTVVALIGPHEVDWTPCRRSKPPAGCEPEYATDGAP